MSDPINPNTLLPMSLQVDRLEQVRQLHEINEQSVLSQKKQKDDEKKNTQINRNRKSEQLLIDNQGSGKRQKNKNNAEREEDNRGDGKKEKSFRGKYIDVKI